MVAIKGLSLQSVQLSAEGRGAGCLAVTPNKRWLAVAERGTGDKGIVTVYDLAILKKRKVLVPQQEGAAARVPSLCHIAPPPHAAP